MNFAECEYLISRFLSGYLLINIGGVRLKIKFPSPKLVYRANKYYQELQARELNCLTRDDIVYFLYKNGLWSDENQDRYESLPEEIEKQKINLYDLAKDKKDTTNIRKIINNSIIEYNFLSNVYHSYDHYTKDGICIFRKNCFLIEHTTFHKNNKFMFDKIPLTEVIKVYSENGISEEKIRFLARNEPWITLNDLYKPKVYNEDFFRLLNYTKLYKNIHKHPECPADFIINDDWAFDGWLLSQKEAKVKESQGNEINSRIRSNKIRQSQEVFVFQDKERPEDQDTQKFLSKVNSLNNGLAKATKAKRMSLLNKHGCMDHEHMPDTKMALREKEINMYKEKIK